VSLGSFSVSSGHSYVKCLILCYITTAAEQRYDILYPLSSVFIREKVERHEADMFVPGVMDILA
jgi:hypothetical protein